MVCYSPLKGYYSSEKNRTGKRSIVFNSKGGLVDRPVSLPCQKCIGCRLERSRQMAARCTHEAQMHPENCFLTLTYSPQYLPLDQSIDIQETQKFLKRLRKKTGTIRFFACGEYGDQLGRPHYHLIIFGYDFPDKIFYKSVNDNRLYTSALLTKIWGKGFCTIGDVTFESAAYVARYCTKKITGLKALSHYKKLIDGVYYTVRPEFGHQSLKPGLGTSWLKKYYRDVYPSDEIVIRGSVMQPPRYYDQLMETISPSLLKQTLKGRSKNYRYHPDNRSRRLRQREIVKLAQITNLKRNIENETPNDDNL
nr:MAG: replication initiation protein [Microvirus sp.]